MRIPSFTPLCVYSHISGVSSSRVWKHSFEIQHQKGRMFICFLSGRVGIYILDVHEHDRDGGLHVFFGKSSFLNICLASPGIDVMIPGLLSKCPAT